MCASVSIKLFDSVQMRLIVDLSSKLPKAIHFFHGNLRPSLVNRNCVPNAHHLLLEFLRCAWHPLRKNLNNNRASRPHRQCGQRSI